MHFTQAQMSLHRIPDFWNWFEDNLATIRAVLLEPSHPDREYVVNSLDHYILSIGMFSWDIEAGREKKWRLIISPNGDEELLELSVEIVAQAPQLMDWEFHPAKPPRPQALQFEVYDEAMDLQPVDARSWQFVLQPAREEKRFLLHVVAAPARGLSDETLNKAVSYLVTCLLGEEVVIRHIGGMKVSGALPEYGRPHAITELPEILESLV